MFSFTTESFIEVQSAKLFFKQLVNHESRPTLVFLHDSLGCVDLWRDFPLKLAELSKFNLLVYDRLGYGKSAPMPSAPRPTNYLELEADVLNCLLIEMKIEEAILFGHSDGGSIALIAASKYPPRIKAVISEAGHVFVEDVTLKGIRAAVHAYQTTDLPLRLAKYHGHKVDTLFKAWAETWTRADYHHWNIEHFLPNITCPVLVIQGDADEYGTLYQVERIVNQVNGRAEKFIIPNVGHTPHKEKPEVVLLGVHKFVVAL